MSRANKPVLTSTQAAQPVAEGVHASKAAQRAQPYAKAAFQQAQTLAELASVQASAAAKLMCQRMAEKAKISFATSANTLIGGAFVGGVNYGLSLPSTQTGSAEDIGTTDSMPSQDPQAVDVPQINLILQGHGDVRHAQHAAETHERAVDRMLQRAASEPLPTTDKPLEDPN